MVRKYFTAMLTAVLIAPASVAARNSLHITHAYANTNAQSLIGLRMGSHKAIVDMKGNPLWSQWSLKHRGQVQKTVNRLISALNFSYTTNVWREEIRVNKDLPPVCDTTPEKRAKFRNGHGTGDMPEAWANANLVNLVRDMLLYRRDETLYVLAGIPSDWIAPGEDILVRNAPVTFGGKVSFQLTYPKPGKMVLTLTPPARPVDIRARFPVREGQSIKSATVDGKTVGTFSESQVFLQHVRMPVTIEVEFQ